MEIRDFGSEVQLLNTETGVREPFTDQDTAFIADALSKPYFSEDKAATSQRESLTDPMMVFYNNLARILREKYPQSNTKLGGMAYVNVTIPPQREFVPEKNLVMWLAPIDIDPNHSMDDPKSPPRQEYRDMMYRWSEIMQGRIVIYDYDQGYLVWRDLPNPSHYVVKDDMKHYRKAGILGIGTETRGAIATTFLNFFFRGQLMWNPDADVDAGRVLSQFLRPGGKAHGRLLERHLQGLGRYHCHRARILCRTRDLYAAVGGTA